MSVIFAGFEVLIYRYQNALPPLKVMVFWCTVKGTIYNNIKYVFFFMVLWSTFCSSHLSARGLTSDHKQSIAATGWNFLFEWPHSVEKQRGAVLTWSIFSKIITKDIPLLALTGELWGVFCGFKLTFIFCPSHLTTSYYIWARYNGTRLCNLC